MGRGVPGVGDDDVVEGGVLLAEAGEAYAEDHCVWVRVRGAKGCLGCVWERDGASEVGGNFWAGVEPSGRRGV